MYHYPHLLATASSVRLWHHAPERPTALVHHNGILLVLICTVLCFSVTPCRIFSLTSLNSIFQEEGAKPQPLALGLNRIDPAALPFLPSQQVCQSAIHK